MELRTLLEVLVRVVNLSDTSIPWDAFTEENGEDTESLTAGDIQTITKSTLITSSVSELAKASET